jgi:hypothetical protein
VQEELSYNGQLSVGQRTALETAVSFVDQISQFQTTYSGGDSWDRKDAVDINISHGEILHVVLASMSSFACQSSLISV